ncbi:MAG: hypothetical protein HQL19_07150 [Candidatus Omnitrophica bacterium]|nr:hypothetical protein [Candidatus Omnitrophota bacterium]
MKNPDRRACVVGQSIIEYVVLVLAVTVVVIALMVKGGPFRKLLNATTQDIVNMIDQRNQEITFTTQ